MNEKKPKVGIALSGSSGRAIAHIGVLEVLKENNIPIDIIVGCSSGALVAVSYATGTMEILKEFFHKLTVKKILSLWSVSLNNGGLLHYNRADSELSKMTKDLKFEDINHPKLAFVAADLNSGELITLDKGDINKAFKASAAVPGLFETVIWENRVLVDGGLVNVVPTNVVKNLGADIVIGVNIAATKFIYEKKLPIWKGYRFLTKLLGLQFLRQIFSKFASRIFFQFDSQSDALVEAEVKSPNSFKVLIQALDLSLKVSESIKGQEIEADIMLEPRVKHFGKIETKNINVIYNEGRYNATQAVSEIKKLIENFQK
jgi:NTE family protein